jgi:hypothetical protein
MKKWNDIADEFSYSKSIPWPTMQQAVLDLGGVPFAPPAENKHMVLDQRDKKLEKLKKDSPGKSPAELFEKWKAPIAAQLGAIKGAAEGIGRLGVAKIHGMRAGAQPRPDANAVGMALGALHTDMGGLEAPKAGEGDVNPPDANPPLEEGEKFGPPEAIAQQPANWNVFVDEGFTQGQLMKPPVAGAPPVARKADGNPANAAAKIPSSGGSPLPSSVRTRMEPKLGADLSGVKLHTGGKSGEAASQLGARAFTVGSDVHFNSGEFAPGSREGDRLIAHELTHVVQAQRSGIQRKAEEGEDKNDAEGAKPGEEAEVSQPGDPAEKEADAVADNVTDDLHGGEKKKGEKGGKKDAKEEAPKIGAKLGTGAAKVFSHVGAVISRKSDEGDKGGDEKKEGGAEAKGGDDKKAGGDDKKGGGDEKKEGGAEAKGGDDKKGGGDEKKGGAEAKGDEKKGGEKDEKKAGEKDEKKPGGKDAKADKDPGHKKKEDDAPDPEEQKAAEGAEGAKDEGPKEAAPAIGAKLSGSAPKIFRAAPTAAPAAPAAAVRTVPFPTAVAGGKCQLAAKGEKLEVQVDGASLIDKLVAAGTKITGAKFPNAAEDLRTAGTAVGTAEKAMAGVKVKDGKIPQTDLANVTSQGDAAGKALLTVRKNFRVATLDEIASGAKNVAPPLPTTLRYGKNKIGDKEFMAQYDVQVKAHEAAMSALTVDDWMTNRTLYQQQQQNVFDTAEETVKTAMVTELKARITEAATRLKRISSGFKKAQGLVKAAETAAAAAEQKPADPGLKAALATALSTLMSDDYVKKNLVGRILVGRPEVQFKKENRAGLDAILLTEQAKWDAAGDLEPGGTILHLPDQVAGGKGFLPTFKGKIPDAPEDGKDGSDEWKAYIEELKTYIGSARVNSAIGPSWEQAAATLATEAQAFFNDATPAAYPVYKIAIKITTEPNS